MRNLCRLLLLLSALITALACAEPVPTLPWQLLRSIPRLPGHFTEGLVYAGPQLFESTGRYGQSRLIAYDATTLQMQQQHFLEQDVFGEGLTVLNGKLYQATWQSRRIFVYDTGLRLLQTLTVAGDCWGLTSNGQHLILSDGTDSLQFLDPADGRVVRRLTVSDGSNMPLRNINELEWLDGDILANIWHQDTVLRIDSKTGRVKGQYDLASLATQLKPLMPVRNSEQVLNGLAWHAGTQTLLVTGKDWPVWFALRLSPH